MPPVQTGDGIQHGLAILHRNLQIAQIHPENHVLGGKPPLNANAMPCSPSSFETRHEPAPRAGRKTGVKAGKIREIVYRLKTTARTVQDCIMNIRRILAPSTEVLPARRTPL